MTRARALLILAPLALAYACAGQDDVATDSCATPTLPAIDQGMVGFAMGGTDDGPPVCTRFDVYFELVAIADRAPVRERGAQAVFQETSTADRIGVQSSRGVFGRALPAGDYLLAWRGDDLDELGFPELVSTGTAALARNTLLFTVPAGRTITVRAIVSPVDYYTLYTLEPEAHGENPLWCPPSTPYDCH